MQFFAGELKSKIGIIAMCCAATFDRLWVFLLACRLSMAYYSEQLICNLLTFCLCIYLQVCIVHTFCTQSMAHYSVQLKRRLHVLHMCILMQYAHKQHVCSK